MEILKHFPKGATRWRTLLGILLVFSCDAFKEPYVYQKDPEPRTPVGFGTGGTAPVPYRCQTFASSVVRPNTYFSVLYSWLSDEELAALRKTRELLVPRSGEPTTILDQWEAESSSLVVDQGWSAVRKRAFSATEARHVWPYPWATFFGPFGNSFAAPALERTHLVRIELREEAILLVQALQSLRAYDGDGQLVSVEQLEQEPERIAAVLGLHTLREGDDTPGSLRGPTPEQLCSFPNPAAGSRSILLFNPAMVQSWSVGSPETIERLDEDDQALREYLQGLRQFGESPLVQNPPCLWFSDTTSCEGSFYQSLTSTTEPYSPTIDSMVTLIDSMGRLPVEDDILRVGFPSSMGGAGGAVSR